MNEVTINIRSWIEEEENPDKTKRESYLFDWKIWEICDGKFESIRGKETFKVKKKQCCCYC